MNQFMRIDTEAKSRNTLKEEQTKDDGRQHLYSQGKTAGRKWNHEVENPDVLKYIFNYIMLDAIHTNFKTFFEILQTQTCQVYSLNNVQKRANKF